MASSVHGRNDWMPRQEVIHINGIRFLIERAHELDSIASDLGTTLATVIDVSECHPAITAEWIDQRMKHYREIDDVFQTQFLQLVWFIGAREILELSPGARSFLTSIGMRSHGFLYDDASKQLSPGPYVILHGIAYEPSRLYMDTHSAFFLATKNLRFIDESVDESGDNFGTIDIAVPSRLRFEASPKRPLLGVRVGVKDNFDLEGTKTSLCSRSYLQTYPRKSTSAPCIQKLLDLGVSIVGKTKLCAFAQWEEATEATEYTSPWSPRADGFQSSGGSSNGSGAAISAYDWLDITIGSDTTGSILRPALWNGCFALRPTFGHLSTDGFVNCIKYLDTPGIMARDLQKCRYFAASWYGDRLNCTVSKFSAIMWPIDYWNLMDQKQREIARKFTLDLQSVLGVQLIEFSLKHEWQRTPPEDAGDQSLDDYMLKATQDMWYDDYHAFDDFQEVFWAKHQRAPYLTPPTREAWDSCKIISKASGDEAARRVHIFRTWFHSTFFVDGQPLFILPLENVAPRYRDDPPDFQRPPTGVHTLLLASFVGSPEIAVPRKFAWIPHSTKTNFIGSFNSIVQIEDNPKGSASSICIRSHGSSSDLMLMDTLITCLKGTGRATVVHTGSDMFVQSKVNSQL